MALSSFASSSFITPFSDGLNRFGPMCADLDPIVDPQGFCLDNGDWGGLPHGRLQPVRIGSFRSGCPNRRDGWIDLFHPNRPIEGPIIYPSQS